MHLRLLLEPQKTFGVLVSILHTKSLRELHCFLPMRGPFFSSVTAKFISDLVYLPGDAARAKGRSVINLLRGKCLQVCQDLRAWTVKKLSNAI